MAKIWRSAVGVALALCLAAGAITGPALAESEGTDHEESSSQHQSEVEKTEKAESDEKETDGEDDSHVRPSPTPAPTPSPTPTPAPTPTASPTPANSPSASPSPSVTPTVSVAPSASPAPSSSPSPISPSPKPSAFDGAAYEPKPPAETPLKVVTDPAKPPAWAPLGLIPVFQAPSVGRATVNGVQVAVVVRAKAQRNGLDFLAPGWQISLGALNTSGAAVQLAADGTLRVERDHSFTTDGAGFAPNSKVDVYVYSSPIKLGRLTTNALGQFTGNFPVPDELADGVHTLQVMGYSATGQVQEGEIPVTLYRAAVKPPVWPPVVKPPVVQPPAVKPPVDPGSFTRSSVIYFKTDQAVTLKRGKKALRAALQTLATLGKNNAKVTGIKLSVANTRKELHPSRNLAVKRLRSILRVVRPRAGNVVVTRAIAPIRQHNWAYVRISVTYQR